MLDAAEAKQREWKEWFDRCRDAGDRDGMKDAARNHKALEGVIKTLRWTLGEVGVSHPDLNGIVIRRVHLGRAWPTTVSRSVFTSAQWTT